MSAKIMKSRSIFFGVLLMLLFAGTQSAFAQRTSEFNVTVTANNQGIFVCTTNVASFDFGPVDADGTDYSTADVNALGRNGANNGGIYENAAGSVTWTCRAAPASIVGIDLISTAADHTVGSMADDDLEIRIPATNGGVSGGYRLFTSGANLITGMNVGNGASGASNDLDLRLNVLDTDPTGANTWVVRMRATGNP